MKKELVEYYINSLNTIAENSLRKNDIDSTCVALTASGSIQYEFNQNYTDDVCENHIAKIVELYRNKLVSYDADDDVVLFYDSFGLDTRGLALIYLKALCDLGYRVIYVVPESSRDRQPEIARQTSGKNIQFCYIRHNIGQGKINELLEMISKYKPRHAFFYTTPNDIEACVGFACMEGRTKRYQINLTDHAFWLGRNAFDYCLEFREYGACVSWKYRRIDKNKLRMLPYYPYVSKDVPFAGFPFSIKGKKILFSGGALYKTIDKTGKYYAIVDHCLNKHKDLVFLYAGSGDATKLMKLQEDYPDRVFHIPERKDLFALLRRCTLYFNTYPMIGGLMSQYSAVAGKIPMTLVADFGSRLDGLLLNCSGIKAEFTNINDLLDEMDRLLDDDEYRQQEEQKLKNCVMTETMFRNSLKQLLEDGRTNFQFSLHEIDTKEFRSNYVERLTLGKLADCIINKNTKAIWIKFPQLLLLRIIDKLSNCINF